MRWTKVRVLPEPGPATISSAFDHGRRRALIGVEGREDA